MTRSSQAGLADPLDGVARAARCEIVVVVTRQPRVRGGVDGEAAPAGADLEHVVVGPELELARRPARAWRPTPPRASSPGARTARTSTSSSGRASARTARCRGRSARRCRGGCGAACCGASAARARWYGSRSGVSAGADASMPRALRAADADHRDEVGRVPERRRRRTRPARGCRAAASARSAGRADLDGRVRARRCRTSCAPAALDDRRASRRGSGAAARATMRRAIAVGHRPHRGAGLDAAPRASARRAWP